MQLEKIEVHIVIFWELWEITDTDYFGLDKVQKNTYASLNFWHQDTPVIILHNMHSRVVFGCISLY